MVTGLIEKAARIAIRAHEGQKRKESDLPYIVHPFMVSLKLSKYSFRDEVLAAALVHDVLEDTDFGVEKLKKELGEELADVLFWVLLMSHDLKIDIKKASIEKMKQNRKGKNLCLDNHNTKTYDLSSNPLVSPVGAKRSTLWVDQTLP